MLRRTCLAAVVLLAACSGADDSTASTADNSSGVDSEPPLVVATTGIWADVVRNMTCSVVSGAGQDHSLVVRVVTLIPEGGDPHVFEPSLADRALLDSANLIVANGLNLEAGLADTLEAAEQAGTAVFRIGNHIDTISAAVPSDHAGLAEPANSDDQADPGGNTGSDGHSHERNDSRERDDSRETDPHIWFDPSRVSAALSALAQSLIDHTGLEAELIDPCQQQYQSELLALDTRLADQFSQIPTNRRKLITNHDSLGYLANRYGLQIVGTISPAASTIAATNPAQLAELAKLIVEDGVAAIFTETQRSTDDAEALVSRAGDVLLVPLYTETLGAPGSGADSYIGMLSTDADRIVDALR